MMLALPLAFMAFAQAAQQWPISALVVEGNQNYTRNQVLAVAGLKIGQLAGKAEFEAARDRLVATGAFESVGYKFGPAEGGKGYRASFQVVEAEPFYEVRFEGLPAEKLKAHLRKTDPLFGDRIAGTQVVIDRYTRAIEQVVNEPVTGRLSTEEPGKFFVLFRPSKQPPSVAEVRFQGNQVIPASDLQNTMTSVAVGEVYREPRFRQLLDANIRPMYEARGHLRVAFPKIEVEPAKDVKGVSVLVTVEEGPTFTLSGVRVSGADPELAKAGKFKTGDLADFSQIEAGRQRIHAALRRSGHMKVTSTIQRSIDDDKKSVGLVINVVPGPKYTFGTLEVKGLDILTEPAIRKMWAMKPGQPYDADYPTLFLDTVRERGIFDDLGKTKADVRVDDKAHTVDVTLHFTGAPPKARKWDQRFLP
jgi:outer membrane protein assembly factor BamA